jgi:alkylation response protein AidB-like acyl-CoA dehydrogenase
MSATAQASVPIGHFPPLPPDTTAPLLERVGTVVRRDLAPLVKAIDKDHFYPADVLRGLGEAGAYAPHVAALNGGRIDLAASIKAMSVVGRECLSTAFCVWCQSTFAWYADNTANAGLRARYAAAGGTGRQLGGTGLSNPMKSFFEIEKLRLKGTRVAGGYVVKGMLPWVSNLGPDHVFGTIFETDDPLPKRVMAMIPCNHPGVTIVPTGEHLALDGTGTYSVQIRDALIGDDLVLADPAEPYVKKVRQGFILLQMGMAFGVVRGCIDIQRQMQPTLGHVNKYLEDQPDELEAELEAAEAECWDLAQAPYDEDGGHWRRTLQARLKGSYLALRSAQAAMLHSGARGYVEAGAAQRRLREAYFVAIVTPATKQLKKMLADLEAAGA